MCFNKKLFYILSLVVLGDIIIYLIYNLCIDQNLGTFSLYLIKPYLKLSLPCKFHCVKCSSYSECIQCDKYYYWNKTNQACELVDESVDQDLIHESYINNKCKYHQCQKCYELDGENYCQKCKKLNLWYYNDLCYTKCPSGSFQLPNKNCKKCSVSGCKLCNSQQGKCEQCFEGYQKSVQNNEDICNQECLEGEYKEDDKCKPCKVSNCKFCSQQGLFCDLCKENTKKYKDECVLKCPSGTYENWDKCNQCSQNCLECKDSSSCEQCNKNYVLDDNKCVQQGECPLGKFENKEKGMCMECKEGCEKCQDQEDCQQCKQDHFKNKENKSCEKSCPIKFFGNQESRTCESCIDKCLKCKDKSTCFQCEQYLYFDAKSNKCLERCDQNCEDDKCENSQCKECQNNYFLFENKCLQKCQENYFGDRALKKCIRCPEGCQKCDSLQTCNKCENKWFLLNSKCINVCPKQFFGDAQSNECTPCMENCLECKSKIQCTLPSEGFYFDKDRQQCMKNCDDFCALCQQSKCQQCKPAKYLFENKCLEKCPQEYYSNKERGKCEQCLDNCAVCANANECQLCKENYFWNGEKKECTNSCPDSQYQDSQTKVCKTCLEQCLKCKDGQSCDKCQKDLTFDSTQKKCVEKQCDENCQKCEKGECIECKAQYYLQDGTCKKCDIGCKTCSQSNKCDSCLSGLFKKDSQCVKKTECGDGYYGDQNTYICKECSINCEKCNSEQLCNLCKSDYYLEHNSKSKCGKNCDLGTYPDKIKRKCLLCNDKNCINCPTENKCVECSLGYIVSKDNQKCEKKCSIDNCLECPENQQKCQKCFDGYQLIEQSTKCIKKKCHASCDCEKGDKCQKCKQLYKDLDESQNRCYQYKCKDGEFYQESSKLCVKKCGKQEVEERKEKMCRPNQELGENTHIKLHRIDQDSHLAVKYQNNTNIISNSQQSQEKPQFCLSNENGSKDPEFAQQGFDINCNNVQEYGKDIQSQEQKILKSYNVANYIYDEELINQYVVSDID